MKDLVKLIEKKKKEGKELDPMVKDAKMSMLDALSNEMSSMMKDDLTHPKHKVEVEASDKHSLAKGLDKAKEAVDSMSNEDDVSEDEDEKLEGPEHEAMESPEYEAGEQEEEGEEDKEDGDHDAEHIIGAQIDRESEEGDLSDEDIAHLEQLLEKAKAKAKKR